MKFIATLISVCLYLMLITGLVFCFRNSFMALYGRLTLRRRLPNLSQKNNAITWLNKLCYAYNGKENSGKWLLGLSLLIFLFVYIVCMNHYSLIFSLVIALLVASVPFGSLVSKIKLNRNRSSLEGPGYLSELYRQYRIENKNINKALENISQNSKDFPLCSKQSYLLLLRIRSAASQREINSYCQDFAFALGTAWGKNTANCIAAAGEGYDISLALIDIIKQLSLAKERREEKKRLNSEALRMTNFLVPIMFFASSWVSVSYLGISPEKLFSNQFLTAEGLLFFLLIIIMFFGNIILLNLIVDDTLDY